MAVQVCSPWVTPDKLCCEGGGSVTDCSGDTEDLVFEWTDEDFILAASNILFARTCFLYPGSCEQSVWPCIACSHRHRCACCGTYSMIELPTDYDIIDITSVTEDGVPLDPSAYRLDGRNRLVRTDGLRWSPNSFDLPNTQCVETVVNYTIGRIPPIELQMAAADLACDLKKACNGESCGLDARVSHLQRRGVELTLTDLTSLLKTGSTGIKSVDYALSIHGNCAGSGFADPLKWRGEEVGRTF